MRIEIKKNARARHKKEKEEWKGGYGTNKYKNEFIRRT